MKRTSTTSALRPIRRLVGAVLLAGVLMGFATACVPPGCAKDCVTSVAFNPGTTKYTVVTTDKAKVTVTIYNEAARTNMVASKASNTFKTSHVITNGALTPNRNYWYTVTATDEAGKAYKELGSFRAAKRTVTVKITSITLNDDSDSVGSGELAFGMKAAGTDFASVYANGDFGSGTTKSGLTVSRAVANGAPSQFTVMVEGIEDDCEGIGSLCGAGTQFSYGAGGSNDDFDWATATSATITAPGENGSGSWSASTSAYALKFSVSGTWTVTYAA